VILKIQSKELMGKKYFSSKTKKLNYTDTETLYFQDIQLNTTSSLTVNDIQVALI